MRDFRLRQADFSAEETTQALQVLRQRYLSLQTTTRLRSGLSASKTADLDYLAPKESDAKRAKLARLARIRSEIDANPALQRRSRNPARGNASARGVLA
jgi:hypothetical protein